MSLRIVTVVGARPQFIKAGPVSRALERVGIAETLIHTGQHYDLNMSDVFFDALGLRQPDHHLGIGSGGHGAQTGAMLAAIEGILVSDTQDAMLVYGDTNSTLAGALAAAKLHIPVVHVEAGLRSFNRKMPEEVNRVLTDHVSSLLYCPTPTAVDHLRNEGIKHGVHMVGDVMKDALDYWGARNKRQVGALNEFGLKSGDYYLATVHRAENVDNPARLDAILEAFAQLDKTVVLPVHPRTRNMLERSGKSLPETVRAIEPVGYLEMLELETGAKALLTDSGGVQKEAYMLGIPCITMRDETEWVETVQTGWNTLVGADTDKILTAVDSLDRTLPHPDLYGDGHASDRIAQTLHSHLARRGSNA